MSEPADMPLIDGHTHCFSFDVMPILAGVMDQCDLRAFNVCGIVCRGGASMIQNPLALLGKLKYRPKVYACGGLCYKLPGRSGEDLDLLGQSKRLMELGFDGIKMIEGKPTAYKALGIPMNDSIYDDYYAWVESEKIPVVFHVADPETFWDRGKIPPHFLKMGWCYDDGTYPGKEQLYSEIDDVLSRFPALCVIFAHFYFLSADMDRAGRVLDKWPNVSFDITPGMEMYGNFSASSDKWRGFFTKYQDRIVFGTDNVCSADEGGLAGSVRKIQKMRRFLATGDEFTFGRYQVRGLALDEATLAKIYHGNFRRYFGDAPKQVDRQELIGYCLEIEALAEGMPQSGEILQGLAEIRAEAEGL